jgi:hypothetical protein
MEFITMPTEQTTAITDAILGIEAILLAVYLQRFALFQRFRTRCWQTLLLFTALASFLGAVAHGFVMSIATYEWLWQPLLLLLGLVVANLVLAAVYDLFGPKAAKRSWPWLLLVGIGFFAVTHMPGVTFFIFIVYEAVGMLFVLVSYGWLAWRGRMPGAAVIAAGIVLQLVAAAVQASGPFEVTMIWVFDHNGLFHLIGMVATFVMVLGAASRLPRSVAVNPKD